MSCSTILVSFMSLFQPTRADLEATTNVLCHIIIIIALPLPPSSYSSIRLKDGSASALVLLTKLLEG